MAREIRLNQGTAAEDVPSPKDHDLMKKGVAAQGTILVGLECFGFGEPTDGSPRRVWMREH